MSEKLHRVPLDLSAAQIASMKQLIAKTDLKNRKAVIVRALLWLATLVKAKEKGLRIVALDKDGKIAESFDLDALPVVDNRSEERTMNAKIEKKYVEKLRDFADRYPDNNLRRISMTIALAAWHPGHPKPISANVLAELVYFAVTLPVPELRALVRDILSNLCSVYESFDAMVSDQAHVPYFDSSFLEQRFLADEYYKIQKTALTNRNIE
jgi:hypothetical protein